MYIKIMELTVKYERVTRQLSSVVRTLEEINRSEAARCTFLYPRQAKAHQMQKQNFTLRNFSRATIDTRSAHEDVAKDA